LPRGPIADDLLGAEFFLYAGMPEQANKAYRTRKISAPSEQREVRLHHLVAEHNLELLAGRTPKAVRSWLPDLMASCQPVKPPLRAIRTELINGQTLRATAVLDAYIGGEPVVQHFNVEPGPGARAGMLSRELIVVPIPGQLLPEGGLLFVDAAAMLRGTPFAGASVSLGGRQRGQPRPAKYAVPCSGQGRPPWAWF
jgi:hypothetical protein